MTSSDPTPSESGCQLALPRLDARLVQWLAVQMVQDARARLVEGGAGPDANIELASVFVDLGVTVRGERERRGFEEDQVIRHVCGEPPNDEEDDSLEPGFGHTARGRGNERWLLVGGPGSGKSTATTMMAQLLRGPWLEELVEELPEALAAKVQPIADRLAELAARLNIKVRRGVLPIRVNLPSLAQWMVSQSTEDSSALLWRYLATRMAEDASAFDLTLEVTEAEAETMMGAAGQVLWVFDGLDEVPRSAGRDKVVSVIRAGLCSNGIRASGLLVTTRPQGYEGELDDLATMVLEAMPVQQAYDYGERLLHAWTGDGPDFAARSATLRRELNRSEIQALVQTPLHTTMAALLVATEGSLPRSRWLLFDHYFGTIFKRELSKPGDHGFRAEDRATLRDLHARVGLVLHVRAQGQAGTRSALLRRELRDELAAIFKEKGHTEEDVAEKAEHMMRFATERLVLLLHASMGEYSFSIRSLQEFFAADALLRGEPTQVRGRLDQIALDPHWSNVLALVASKCALADSGQSTASLLDYTVGVCRGLNDGTCGGEAAKLCFLGSRLALVMLRETESYGEPWLHDALWKIALEAGTSPVQFAVRTRAIEDDPRAHLLSSTPTIWNDAVELHMRLGRVAANWEGHGKKLRSAAILEAAQGLLQSVGTERRLAGWLLLHGLLAVDAPEAILLATAHAPTERDYARKVVNVLLDRHEPAEAPAWLVDFIQNHVGWFTPPWISREQVPAHLRGVVAVFDIVRLFGFNVKRAIERVVVEEYLLIFVVSIESGRSAWRALLGRLPQDSVEWEVWRAIVSFHADPSPLTLAEALDAAAAEPAFKEIKRRQASLAWPLAACVKFVGQPEELRALAACARRGDLGNVEGWRAAEARWRRSQQVTEEELNEWLVPGSLPWRGDIAERGVVLTGFLGFRRNPRVPQGEHKDRWGRVLRQISDHTRQSGRALEMLEWVSEYTVPLLLETADSEIVPLEVAARAEEIEPLQESNPLLCVDQLLPNLHGPNAERWFALLDERGRRCANGWSSAGSEDGKVRCRQRENADALVRRLRERPEQWGLMDALLATLAVAPDTDLSSMPELQLPADAPQDIHATAAFFRLLCGQYDVPERERLVRQMVEAAGSKRGGFYELITEILAQRDRDADGVLQTIVTMLRESGLSYSCRDLLMSALFARLSRSVRPAFASPEAWEQHALPGPFLSGQEPERRPSQLVRLVELSNVRLFKDSPSVDVAFPVPPANSGQWILLTGENGVGKTTLLRALALALAPPAAASKLLDERLPMIRNGGEARVSIEVDASVLSAVVRYKERTETVEVGDKESENVRRPWVVGYGVRRGNARGEPDRELEWGPTGELHTLFDRPASLVNAADWLIKLDRQVLREQRQQGKETPGAPAGSRTAVWEAVEQALKTLLGVTAIEPEDEHMFVQHPDFGRVRLDALSDGYLTTTGWVIDLVARWIDRKRVLDAPLGPDVLRSMTGFVLIDEIDLHLHPIWQMRIVDDIRRLFPRLSFVVTTHNPLTLQGARPGEVYVMRRNGDRIELTQRDIRPGYDVDRVLFEQFGIKDTFDKGTRELLRKHRELLEGGALPDDPERLRVEAELVKRLGGVGEIVRAERRAGTDPLPVLAPDEQHLLTPFLKKKP